MGVEQLTPELVEATRWVWPYLKETFTKGLQNSIQELTQAQSTKLPKHDLDQISQMIVGLNERALASLESDPEAQKVVPLYACQPAVCIEKLFLLYANYLRQHALAAAKPEPGACFTAGPGYAGALEEALDLGERLVKQYLEQYFKPHRAVREVLEQGRYEVAVEIIRGQLALEPHDIEMINHLATVGCLSGRVCLIIEARAKAEEVFSDQKVIAHPNPWPMAQFLQANVVEGIVVGISPLTAGGIILPKGLSEPTQKEWLETSSTILNQSAREVTKRLLATTTWTEENFLAMCREVISEQCCRYQRWKPGTLIAPKFKDQELPERFRGKIQFIDPSQLSR